MKTLFIIATCFLLQTSVVRAESMDEQGAEVQTRGPVHEAFAGVISFKPEPGLEISKEPPDLIEEVPPNEKPEGENITWIPGYWAWDDERGDFLWVSGVWRALPPGRRWVSGSWSESGDGYQWTSGYWADANRGRTAYLPAPPEPLENGPSVEAPSENYVWVPGCWIWVSSMHRPHHYAWRPGYWILGREDWDWSPDYYVWTSHGYVFVGGYWDYSVGHRGVLFAPVYFEPSWRAHRVRRYSPVIVIDRAVFPDHLFLRPTYRHYYFGDYYAARYSGSGFQASFSFQSRGFGYDPIYAHQRWEHRSDRNWEHDVQVRHQFRRDHDNARPSRTWNDVKSEIQNSKPAERSPIARPFAPRLENGSRRSEKLLPPPSKPAVPQVRERREEAPDRERNNRQRKSDRGGKNPDDEKKEHPKRARQR